jgi:peptidoglycan/LPS O-acetylase OafA/YrhL
VVWTGRISYSLYLVHWPVIVFYQAFIFDDLVGAAERWTVVGISFALAALQYRLVEERFRHAGPESLPGPRFLVRAVLAGAALAAAGGTTLVSGG